MTSILHILVWPLCVSQVLPRALHVFSCSVWSEARWSLMSLSQQLFWTEFALESLIPESAAKDVEQSRNRYYIKKHESFLDSNDGF